MKSIVYSQYGPSSVLSLVVRPLPQPGRGEVRVRVTVSGVNPTDWKARLRAGSAASGHREHTPNQDGAGIIDAVGDDVSSVAVGDRVWIFAAAYRRPTGTAQEFTVLPVALVARLPENASFDVGASLGVPAITAHRALTVHEDAPRRLARGALAGKVVLIAGGAGTVGHAAIQLARWSGARVVATTSSDHKARLALAAGAHATVNYREPGADRRVRELAPDGVDIVVEVAPAHNAGLNAAVLAPRGTVAVYANEGGGAISLDFRTHLTANARYQFIVIYSMGEDALACAVKAIGAATADGALPVGAQAGLPLIRFPLEDTAAAHDAVERGIIGKVLIDIPLT
jgi:NADPH2:quinone reductase